MTGFRSFKHTGGALPKAHLALVFSSLQLVPPQAFISGRKSPFLPNKAI